MIDAAGGEGRARPSDETPRDDDKGPDVDPALGRKLAVLVRRQGDEIRDLDTRVGALLVRLEEAGKTIAEFARWRERYEHAVLKGESAIELEKTRRATVEKERDEARAALAKFEAAAVTRAKKWVDERAEILAARDRAEKERDELRAEVESLRASMGTAEDEGETAQ